MPGGGDDGAAWLRTNNQAARDATRSGMHLHVVHGARRNGRLC